MHGEKVGPIAMQHLNSGAATSIFASCGSSGNSDIMMPTCTDAEPGAKQVRQEGQSPSIAIAEPRLVLQTCVDKYDRCGR